MSFTKKFRFRKTSAAASANAIADQRRHYYKTILQTLAGGKRDNLNADEARVLKLWPADVTDKELGAAAGRIRLQLGLI